MRRYADISTLTVPVTVRERQVCDELKARLGFGSDASLVRTALFNLAQHADVNVDCDLFRLRSDGKASAATRRLRRSA